MKILANFKMNKTQEQTKEYLMNFLPKVKSSKHDIILCFPFTSLAMAKFMTSGSNVKLGAQNVSDDEIGGNTGEISSAMIKDVGASFVLVGHSERRSKFKENSKLINKKIKLALKNGLGVVLCVGESLIEKNTLKTADTLKQQIEEALKGIYENELEKITIAYEPIWAIGTGLTPTFKEIDISARVIRKVIENDFSDKAGDNISIVYGGSVSGENMKQLSKAKDINGFLIGGACLDANNFAQMISNL